MGHEKRGTGAGAAATKDDAVAEGLGLFGDPGDPADTGLAAGAYEDLCLALDLDGVRKLNELVRLLLGQGGRP